MDIEDKLISVIGILGVVLVAFFFSYYIVDPGETALQIRMGKIVSCTDVSGFYLKAPIDKIVRINNRIVKSGIETEALSHDLQFVSIGVAINYRINNAQDIFNRVGPDIVKVIIDPFAQESIKAIVAQYTAEGLIQFRHKAKEKVFDELKERLSPFNITLIDFNFVHLDFSKDFLHAVENKQIAMQSALTAKNLTEKIKEEALQTKERAEAEAYAMEVKRKSVNQETIMLKAIEKWDGKLPVTMASNPLPFMNIVK